MAWLGIRGAGGWELWRRGWGGAGLLGVVLGRGGWGAWEVVNVGRGGRG